MVARVRFETPVLVHVTFELEPIDEEEATFLTGLALRMTLGQIIERKLTITLWLRILNVLNRLHTYAGFCVKRVVNEASELFGINMTSLGNV